MNNQTLQNDSHNSSEEDNSEIENQLRSLWLGMRDSNFFEAKKSTVVSVDLVISAWLGRQGSNLRMLVPKTSALPLGHAPLSCW